MNLKSKVVIVEKIILLKTAWKKKSPPFKSYADLFNTQAIFQAWVVFLAFWQIITYNASFYDIVNDFNFLLKILNQTKVHSWIVSHIYNKQYLQNLSYFICSRRILSRMFTFQHLDSIFK